MKNKKQVWMEMTVGLMGFALLAMLFVLTVILSSEALFRRSSPMTVVFSEVMGLRMGDNVVSRGVSVGKVKEIKFAETGVHVNILLNQPLFLKEDYRIEVQSSSLLGGRHLVIHEGQSAGKLPPDAELRGTIVPDVIDAAGQAIEDLRAALNEGILDDFRLTMANIRKLTDGLTAGEGLLGALLMDEKMAEDLRVTLAGLREVGDAIASGEGTLGKLVKEDAIYEDAAVMMANLRGVSDTIAKGEGTLGKLLSNDDQFYSDLTATVASLRLVGENLAAGKGTLGLLLSDDGVYTDLQALLREGRAAVDDMRETSPITTFSSVFFGIF